MARWAMVINATFAPIASKLSQRALTPFTTTATLAQSRSIKCSKLWEVSAALLDWLTTLWSALFADRVLKRMLVHNDQVEQVETEQLAQ